MEQVYEEVCEEVCGASLWRSLWSKFVGEAYENFVGNFMRPFRTKKGVTDATPFISL